MATKTKTSDSARNGKATANGHTNGAGAAPLPGQLVAVGMVPGELTLPVSAIVPSPLNPRKHFAEGPLQDLAASIRDHGILEPIVVRPLAEAPPDAAQFTIVAGERRWRAAQLAGLERVPVRILDDVDDARHLQLALIENLQRQDLDPIEEAEGYRQLVDVAGMRQAAVAAAVNRAQPTVANALRLLDLPEDVQDLIRRRELSPAHGRALARFKEYPKLASRLATVAIERNLTSKALESRPLDEWAIGDALHRDGLTRPLDPYQTRFDIKQCTACPFGAKVGNTCIRPEHYDELTREAEAARKREREEAVAEAQRSGQEVLQLAKLSYADYEQIHGDRPPGCTADGCPCARKALDSNGRMVPICVDPKRYRRLSTADERATKKAKKHQGEAEALRMRSLVSALGEPTSRELAILAVLALGRISALTIVKEAVERQVPGLIALTAERGGERWSAPVMLRQLEGLRTDELIRFVLDAYLTQQIRDIFEASYTWGDGPSLAKWYLGIRDDKPAANGTAAPFGGDVVDDAYARAVGDDGADCRPAEIAEEVTLP